MPNSGDYWSVNLRHLADSLSDDINDYHKQHVQYDQQYQIGEALSRLGISDTGQLTPIDPNDPNSKSLQPIINPKALEPFQAKNNRERARLQGGIEALNRLGVGTAQRLIAQKLDEQSIESRQAQELFPLKKTQEELQNKHLEKLIGDEDKINVPGFGMMTPSQYSAHTARMARVEALQKKMEPIQHFESQLQNTYGLGIKDIVDASQPQEFSDSKGRKYKGQQYVDASGNPVSAEAINANPALAQFTYVQAGPNRIPIPLVDKEGLGWSQIVPKAKNFYSKQTEIMGTQKILDDQTKIQQAQQIMSVISKKDQSQLTDEDRAAMEYAKQVLGK
jgi:hypothetical protein